MKASCSARWNPTLLMLESIINLEREVDNVLKHDGYRELCLHADELDILKELIDFLRHFKTLTDVFGVSQFTLSIMPIMKIKIKSCVSLHQQMITRLRQ